MGLQDYIEKLRTKPRRERERIAVIATGVSFAIIFAIWLVSFSEMNKNVSPEPNSVPLTDQLEDMKSSMERDKQSIQDMMQSLPQEEIGDSTQDSNTYQENGSLDNTEPENDDQQVPSLP